LRLTPVTRDQAKQFVARHHRHSRAPISWKFGVGVEYDGELIGVAMAGRPVARHLDTLRAIEITRVCIGHSIGPMNAASMLYGAVCRAAAALGYEIAYTYTLQREHGTSLRAAGFEVDAEVPGQKTWGSVKRPRLQTDIFGDHTRDPGPKTRWKRILR